MNETSATPPEGAKAVTANDVISQPVPERVEDVELWSFTSVTGFTLPPIMVRPENGEKANVLQSPLDNSFHGVLFELRDGTDKNEKTRRVYFPIGAGLYNFEQQFHKMPHYKAGDSPIEREMKLQKDKRDNSIQQKAARLAAGLDQTDFDNES